MSKNFSASAEEEIRGITIDTLARKLTEVEVAVSEEDVLKYSGPEISKQTAKYTELLNMAKAAIEARFAATADSFTKIVTDQTAFIEAKKLELEAIVNEGLKKHQALAVSLANKLDSMLHISSEPEVKEEAATAIKEAMVGESPYHTFLAKYGQPGSACKPILTIGGAGSGKTTGAMHFALSSGFDKVVLLEGHDGIEANDLVGGMFPHDGRTIWRDGKLALAFRYAAAGLKTCLVIDEFYRIGRMHRSPFISALSPFTYPGGVSMYKLSTGRIIKVDDGMALDEEVLYAPVSNLTIIATTNVGSGYDVEGGDPAEAGRWIPYDLESTEENARYILKEVLATKKSWSATDKNSAERKLIAVLNLGKKMRHDNFLELAPDVRILCDSIKLSNAFADITKTLSEVGMIWVGFTADGVRSPEQIEKLKELISTAWRA